MIFFQVADKFITNTLDSTAIFERESIEKYFLLFKMFRKSRFFMLVKFLLSVNTYVQFLSKKTLTQINKVKITIINRYEEQEGGVRREINKQNGRRSQFFAGKRGTIY